MARAEASRTLLVGVIGIGTGEGSREPGSRVGILGSSTVQCYRMGSNPVHVVLGTSTILDYVWMQNRRSLSGWLNFLKLTNVEVRNEQRPHRSVPAYCTVRQDRSAVTHSLVSTINGRRNFLISFMPVQI